jgi:hypothetical protein
MITSLSFDLIITVKKLLVKYFLDFFKIGDIYRTYLSIGSAPVDPSPPVQDLAP